MKHIALLFSLVCATAFAAMVAGFGNLSATIVETGLSVNYTENGIQPNGAANIRAVGDATATWGCVNRGGHNPASPNKKATVRNQASTEIHVTADGSGVASGAITLRLPTAPNLNCPNGQDKVLGTITFTNVRIKDKATGALASVPGVFTRTYVALR